MTVSAFKVVAWYLRCGYDWDFDESYFLTDGEDHHWRVVEKPTHVRMYHSVEISICRGELDFTKDLKFIKNHLPKFYAWLTVQFKEPARMRVNK